ncbi:MAG: acetyl-CoA C-acyltransferase [marine benthic group bacterium]|nr:acetyl-CoA C-acyltransferase [Gemmatimonadota bacterium]MCL7962095.1 acetyl-CoA C-acyltransferase [Candidatus Carthagonibacter metallireducens]MCL7967655.1 acetyl-CoA C-acyltransferase [Gemmatimonadota bacterium]MCL7968551.1 acetyl-CoA C-acyltransferase [Gemmatimonadota bacterium]MCL7979436.1 acetyl-CoA C-acyltransferase [Gemmatimonadota bacterium]
MSDGDRTAVIVGAARLPTGRFLGGLSSLSAPQLGARAIAAAVERSGVDPAELDDVIMGNVVQAGVGQAPARQAAIGAGLPPTIPALTINKVCGSGLKAVMLAAQAIKAGDMRAAVAGGMESMSNAPYLVKGFRDGVKFGDRKLIDALIHDGLWCAFGDCHMGGHAEYTALKAGVTREEQDAYAADSHRKAVVAIDAGAFADEIVPVEIVGRKGKVTVVDTDEPPRRDTSVEALAKLRPAFAGDAPPEVTEPSVTAGNAPGLNDGGAATVVTSESFAKANGLDILGRVSAYSVGATAPRDLFFAPIDAVRRLMAKEGTSIDDYGLIEVNEAFAVQAIADARELEMDLDRVNVRGGAIALGHPIGASGAKILTTLLYAMRDLDVDRGMATLCLGGGNAVALSVERA